MRIFLEIWSGRLVSQLTSEAVAFAVGIWLFQQTGTALDFTLLLLFNSLPQCLVAPFAGVLVDRLHRGRLLVWSDCGNALSSLLLLVLVGADLLRPDLLYGLVVVGACLRAVHIPAWQALTAEIIPSKDLPRATGLNQLVPALGLVLGPLLGSLLLHHIGLAGVVLCDGAGFLFAALVLLRLPRRKQAEQHPRETMSLATLSAGGSWLLGRPALVMLLVFFAAVNGAGVMGTALVTPYLLSFTDASGLAFVAASGGCGMIAGSLWVAVRNGFTRKIRAILLLLLVNGAANGFIGRFPHVPLTAVSAFVGAAAFAALNASAYAVWLERVPKKLQGRVFSIATALATITMPPAYAVSGWLVDTVLNPWIASLPATFWWLGDGPARGIGVMWMGAGMLIVFLALAGSFLPLLWDLENQPSPIPQESRSTLRDSNPTNQAT